MTRFEDFERWAAAARGDVGPRPDVAAAVLRRLEAEEEPAPLPAAWAWASAGAALASAMLGYYSWQAMLGNCFDWARDFTAWSPL
ncbi:MAG TPA: hypothetical protein VNI01_07960 [Elusimicrobiota bacterium]|jgi:hypothetical protein|nr:hypothetical protein [Elusimicrobiota bacterium]